MEYTKKMTLVPEELARAVQASTLKDQPSRRVLSKLDSEMHAILNSNGISDKEKVVRYNEVLQKFLQLHQQETKPLPIHVNVKDVKGPVSPPELCWSVPGAVKKIHHRSLPFTTV